VEKENEGMKGQLAKRGSSGENGHNIGVYVCVHYVSIGIKVFVSSWTTSH